MPAYDCALYHIEKVLSSSVCTGFWYLTVTALLHLVIPEPDIRR
jgi:hypothetical protein